MTKPDGTETATERDAKKINRSPEVASPSCEPYIPDVAAHPEVFAALQEPALPEIGRVPAETADVGGAGVDEMTNAGGAAKEEDEEELSSFTPKSPLSMPYIPDELNDPSAYPATHAAYKEAQAKYREKLNRRYHLFTLPHEPPESSCLFNHRDLFPIRETARNAVLHAAKSVIRLSSSVDGKPLANCCGLWIKWDEESKTGIVLTTAQLIRSNNSKHSTYTIANHSEGADRYHIQANVIVHMLDDTTAEGHYLYHQEHYDLAFFEVRLDEPVDLPSFGGSVHSGQDVFRLARDVHMNLRITHGWVEDRNPGSNDRHHSMYLSHQKTDYRPRKDFNNYVYHQKKEDYPCNEDGGSIIDLDGKVVGLFNKHPTKSFVPSYILDKCVDLWLKFRCIPRLHLGMEFISIKLLDPIQAEKLWRMYKIEVGLIVQKVSAESNAEKLGICLGDIIERFNGECISTTVELEKMLLGRCRDHLDQGNHLNEQIDVSIQVFHTEERFRRNINLSVAVSDCGEVVKKRTYPITAIEATHASGQSSQNVADDPWLPRPKRTWESYLNASTEKVLGGKKRVQD